MKKISSRIRVSGEQGTAVIAALVMVVGLGAFSLSLVTMVGSAYEERETSRDELSAKLVAEAGLAEAVFRIQSGLDPELGTQEAPVDAGTGAYWVEEVDLGGGLRSLTSTGVDGLGAARLQLVLRAESGAFFQWGAFGAEGIGLARNARIDSYDSTLGTYASQATNSSGTDLYASQNGNVGSNGDVTLQQNSQVHGDALCGPTAVTSVLGNAVVSGSTTPATAEVEMPTIELPSGATSIGDYSVGSDETLIAGDHAAGVMVIENHVTLTIEGPATLLLQSLTLETGAQLLVDSTNGPVEVFVVGDFIVNSNTLIAPIDRDPSALSLNLVSDNVIHPEQDVDLDELDDLEFDSNAQLFGTIYAPNAFIEIDSNFELFGSLVARRVRLDSNSLIHFDEALQTAGGSDSGALETLLWRELPTPRGLGHH
jgi:hypothetical protein